MTVALNAGRQNSHILLMGYVNAVITGNPQGNGEGRMGASNAGYYAHVYRLPEDREWVEAHTDDLIALGQGLIERSKWYDYA